MLKEEAISPAVATENLLLREAIDAKENCDAMTLNVLSVFAQCDMSESINGEQATLKIRSVLVEMFCEIASEAHKDFVTYNNNNKISHVNILKLLHGILKALIICY